MAGLDFEKLNQRLLSNAPHYLRKWNFEGVVEDDTFYSGDYQGNPGRSMRFDLTSGKYNDFNPASGKGGRGLIALRMRKEGWTSFETAKRIIEEEGWDIDEFRKASNVRRKRKSKRDHPLRAVLPVPNDIEKPSSWAGKSFPGKPDYLYSQSWEYRDADGNLLFYKIRYEKTVGDKTHKIVVPYCYFGRKHGWRHKGPSCEKEPLYGLQALAANPEKRVLIVEGEKPTDAAPLLIDDFTVVTWSGGGNSISRADWSVLKGRDAVYWRDADIAGEATIDILTSALAVAEVASLAIVELPPGLPKGWDLADPIPEFVDVNLCIENARKVDLESARSLQYTSYAKLPRRFVFDVSSELFVDLPTGLSFTVRQLNALFRHLPEAKTVGIAGQFLSEFPERKVLKAGYRPGSTDEIFNENGMTLLNTWKPSGIESIEGDAGTFVEHLKFIASTEAEAEFLADTFAFWLQQPGEKTMFAPLVIGKPGTGKSYFGDLFAILMGNQNVTMVTTTELKGDFNEYMVNKQLIVVEELMALGRREITNTLKPLITQHTIPVHIKYCRRLEIENPANFLLFSNHENAILLDDNDRRFFIILNDDLPRPPEYYDRLWSWTAENYGVILHWLLNRDLSNFAPTHAPPMTEGKKRVVNAGRSNLELEICEMIERYITPFKGDLVELSTVVLSIGREYGVSQNIIRVALQKAGAKSLGQHKMVEHGREIRHSIWAVRNVEKWEQLSQVERIRRFLKDGKLPDFPSSDSALPF